MKNSPSNNKLEVGLGRDISGDPITVPLNEMPHLLGRIDG